MKLKRHSAALALFVLAAACDSTEPSNAPPVAAFTASCGQLACVFQNASADPDGTIAVYAWSFGDGGTSAAARPAHTYAAPGGQFTVTLVVTDNDGAAATVSQKVMASADSLPAANRAPVPYFSVRCTAMACAFADRSHDLDAGDSVVAWSWNFGDGTTSVDSAPAHTYVAPGGRFTPTLTVTDGRGATATVAQVLDVGPGGPPPVAGQIAFSRDGMIYLANTDGTGLVQLSAGPADSEPAWSRDGSRIAFSRGGEAGGIYVMAADGGNPLRRASAGESPTWSPDGRSIAFACGAPALNAICKVSASDDGTSPTTILTTNSPVSVRHTAWSPDNTRIAFSSDWALPEFWLDIWLVAPDGSQPMVLRGHRSAPDFGPDDLQPAWSPDGRRIAVLECPLTFSYCYSGALSVMNADGSGLVRLFSASGYAHPTWSPDGQMIAFASGNSIAWISADGSQRGQIIANGATPAWRPRN